MIKIFLILEFSEKQKKQTSKTRHLTDYGFLIATTKI